MLFSTGTNVIDVDVAKTKELYFDALYIWQRCQCPVCRNFDESMQCFDKDSFSFLKELGIIPEKCEELWAYEPGCKKGTQKYAVTYPVVCKVVQYDPDNVESYTFDGGVSVSIIVKDFSVFLKLDLELEWKHK